MQKKLATSIVSVLIFIGASFAGTAKSEGETPQDGLKAIVELYKKQDWEGLVKQRCLDTKHADSEAAVQELVANLSSQFSEKDTLSALVASYEAALAAEPKVNAEGKVAIFASEMGSVKLSKMENGVWGLRF
ncbi:hypothetical protein [Pelagicoccus mobilis]|uniref:Uncharacterized protein n=1 Tax=Pelagicoccus mobilis TaxID=415221 RepID=A0A934VPX8_9BACT|nr:hypothetical protein [Pelagicoccus mobilis]MBK1877747.1 hypothetical protein [Pelagicoccus mobilis]